MDLKVNQKIEIIVEEGIYKDTYPSRVEEITKESIVLGMPIRHGRLIPLPPGEKIKIIYNINLSKTGKQLITLGFDSEVLIRLTEPIPLLFIKMPEKETIYKVQRRNFVRLETVLPVQYQIITTSKLVGEKPFISAQTRDLSGGGLAMTTEELIPVQTALNLLIGLQKGEVGAVGKVVRCVSLAPIAEGRFAVGVEFTEITTQAQEKIVRYIFELQRELRGKGLL